MRELKLVKGEVTYKVNVATLVSTSIDFNEEYQDKYLCESEIKELLEKQYNRENDIIEILPGQIGFEI